MVCLEQHEKVWVFRLVMGHGCGQLLCHAGGSVLPDLGLVMDEFFEGLSVELFGMSLHDLNGVDEVACGMLFGVYDLVFLKVVLAQGLSQRDGELV